MELTDVAGILTAAVGRSTFTGWALLAAVVLALIKAWPVLQLNAQNARAALRGEERTDLGDCRKRMDAMEKEFRAATATMTKQIHQLDLKLVGSVAAYRVLHDDMTEHQPDSSALLHARSMFQAVWDGALPASS